MSNVFNDIWIKIQSCCLLKTVLQSQSWKICLFTVQLFPLLCNVEVVFGCTHTARLKLSQWFLTRGSFGSQVAFGSVQRYFVITITPKRVGFPSGSVLKNPSASAGDTGNTSHIPESGRSPGKGNGNPLQYSLPWEFHEQRSMACCSPWGCRESDTTEWTCSTQRAYYQHLMGRSQGCCEMLYNVQKGPHNQWSSGVNHLCQGWESLNKPQVNSK